jgi:hypothetical protein
MSTDLDPRSLYSNPFSTNIYSNSSQKPSLENTFKQIMKVSNSSSNENKDFYTRINNFFINSDSLANIRDKDAVFNYIQNIHQDKTNELNQLNKTLLNQTQVTKQIYRADDYSANSSIFYTAFIKYTFLLTSVIFILAALTITNKLSTRSCMIISIIIIALFTTVFMLNISSNMTRLKTDWNKYNWGGIRLNNEANMSS